MGSPSNPSPEASGPAPSPIDLCTVDDVVDWLKAGNQTSGASASMQGCITAFGRYMLRKANLLPKDGSQPTESPFRQQVNADENYDGNGSDRLFLRIWPIVSVSVLTIDGKPMPESTDTTQPGYVIDGKSLVLRGGGARWPYGFGGRNTRGLAIGYRFSEGVQNVNVQYTGGFEQVPEDLWLASVRTVALNYRRRGWIGQRSQMYPEAGSTSYTTWEFDPADEAVIKDYMPRHY